MATTSSLSTTDDTITHLISPEAFSYEEILTELSALIENKYADTDGAWRDFYAFGAGQIILELLAGLGAFTTYAAAASRKEAYLSQAALDSSARAIAGPLGYSAFRGSNAVLRISTYANGVTSIQPFDKLGSYEDDAGSFDLLALEADTLSPPTSEYAVPESVDVVIGKLASVQRIIPSMKAQTVRFTQEGISDHYFVRLNGKIVPHSEDVLDLINGKYVLVTNAHGSVDVLMVNEYLAPEHQYRAGYEIEIVYVDYHPITRPLLAGASLTIGTIENASVGQRTLEPDTVQEIQVKAPLRHETGRVVRGRDDFMKMVKQHLPNSLDVRARDLDSATQQLAYLLETGDELTESELERIEGIIGSGAARPMGVKPPTLQAARPRYVTLDVQVVLRTGGLPTTSITQDVLSAISVYEMAIGSEVDVYDLEHAIGAKASYAKAIRVTPIDLDEGVVTLSGTSTERSPLDLTWDEYYVFQPRVDLLTADDYYQETAGPVQQS